jgi:competence protein ComEA
MPQIGRSSLVMYAAFALVVVLLGARFLHRQQPASASGGGASSQPTRAAPERAGGSAVQIGRPAAAGSTVHVAGAVRRPGVYRLPSGARVQDALRRAGGARPGADVNAINLAAKIADGQQVVVPKRLSGGGATASAGATTGAAASTAPGGTAAAGPISLNSATEAQLDTLDGVGPATARKIIEWRTQHGGFTSVADLGQVPGIGPKKLAALRNQVQP